MRVNPGNHKSRNKLINRSLLYFDRKENTRLGLVNLRLLTLRLVLHSLYDKLFKRIDWLQYRKFLESLFFSQSMRLKFVIRKIHSLMTTIQYCMNTDFLKARKRIDFNLKKSILSKIEHYRIDIKNRFFSKKKSILSKIDSESHIPR